MARTKNSKNKIPDVGNMVRWEEIKQEYLYGIKDKNGGLVFPSIRDLGKRHSVPFTTISNHSRDGKWLEERTRIQEQMRQLLRDKAKERGITSMLDVCNQHIMITDTLMAMFIKGVQDGSIPITAAVGFQVIKERYRLYEDMFLGHRRGDQIAVQVNNNIGIETISDEEEADFYDMGKSLRNGIIRATAVAEKSVDEGAEDA